MLVRVAKAFFKVLPSSVQKKIIYAKARRERGSIIENWIKNGKPIPSPSPVKQEIVKQYQSASSYKVLIETGTYLGDMVDAQKGNFNKIISIELGDKLWADAVKRFKAYPHITIMKGDSGHVLDTITQGLDEPAIFWLDGHYSGGITAKGEKDCPILKEIDAIFRYKTIPHVILVDDARMFTGEGDYPTIDELTRYIQTKSNTYNVKVEDDIIRYTIN